MNGSTETKFSGKVAIILASISLAGTIVSKGADMYMHRQKPDEPQVDKSATSQEMTNLPANMSSDNDCRMFNDIQMCWGKAQLKITDSHTRSFTFKFKKQFAGAPVITNSIDTKSTGYAYAVYNHYLTETDYAGNIVEVGLRKNQSPVEFSYIAVGRPAGK